MNDHRVDRAGAAAASGGRTLEVFAQTARINRWIYERLGKVNGEVLEVGSGIGNLSRVIIEDAARAVLTEVEPEYLEVLRRRYAGSDRVDVVRWDLDEPPPADLVERRFDAVISVNVIEHLRDDRATVSAMAALLKPGGCLHIYVPACPFAFGSLDRVLGHYRRYTRRSLAALLAEAGLEVERPRYMNRLGLIGWFVSARILRRTLLSARLVSLFERLVWFARAFDAATAVLPAGLGLVTRARKPRTRS
jgi:SAM-dependent methyltransferase